MNRLNQDNSSSPFKKRKLNENEQIDDTDSSQSYNETINSFNSFDSYFQSSISIDLIKDLELTYYFKIKGKIINKSPIIITKNNEFFSFNLKDRTGEIRVKIFDLLCTKLYNKIKLNSFITIQNGRTQLVDRNYNSTDHNYEIILTENSIISTNEDQIDLPSIKYNFINFNQLAKMNKDKMIDVIGIVFQIDETTTFKNSETNIIDDIIVLRKVKFSNFYGLSLSLLFDTTVEINPNLDEQIRLRNWYNNYKHSLVAKNLNELSNSKSNYNLDNLSLINFDYVKEKEKLYTNAKAIILKLGEPNIYKACEMCNKKLKPLSNGNLSCSKCNLVSNGEQFKWCMLLKVFIGDHTNSIWIKLFNQEIESILSIPIANLGEYYENGDSKKIDDILNKLLFKNFTFELKSTIDKFYSKESLETIATRVDNLNLINYGRMLLKQIKNLNY